MSNALPEGAIRFYFDTRSPVRAELIGELIIETARDLRQAGFSDLQVRRAGKGSTELELIALEKAKIELDTAKTKRMAAKIGLGVVAIGSLGGLASWALAKGDDITRGEGRTASVVEEIMLEGDATQVTISVDSLTIVIPRDTLEGDPVTSDASGGEGTLSTKDPLDEFFEDRDLEVYDYQGQTPAFRSMVSIAKQPHQNSTTIRVGNLDNDRTKRPVLQTKEGPVALHGIHDKLPIMHRAAVQVETIVDIDGLEYPIRITLLEPDVMAN